eukprot:CAMPEP_0181108334 /NCGR_PEP_ID=MMETSP1071-20121207/17575_1 /TAXON_ID=35127 /ORGANISM="Thalassiosira sp., Strain NH16" /LENGTH=414 /DNA_ID=CAMNT_0023191931 /DNA_START=106 /DNA_END=1350 /DNA_ORIENTATION=+
MGFRSLLKKVEAEATKELEKYLDASTGASAGSTTTTKSDAKPPKFDSKTNPPTRWEKAVFSMNGILAQVSQIDPDGVDVVCFPGSDGGEGGTGYDIYRNVKDTKGLEELVTAHEPKGDCKMGDAMDVVLKEAFDRGFEERPCSVLVFTAGRPSDHEAISKKLEDAASKVQKDSDLTITFVQVGDDEWAENYLKQLDTELTTTSADGELIDIVDSIKDEDIQKAVDEMKGGKGSSGITGGLVGAFAGAAAVSREVSSGHLQVQQRYTKGWNGRWKCIYEGDEMCVLDVKDDGEGNLKISGWDKDGTTIGSYAETEDGFNIQHGQLANENEMIVGAIVPFNGVFVNNGTHDHLVFVRELSMLDVEPILGLCGAVAAGATGCLLEKKFFNKASNNVKSDYVIVLDRSGMMAVPDTGK